MLTEEIENLMEERIYNMFDVVENKGRKQCEFTPKRKYEKTLTSYTVSFKEASNVKDACVIVYKSLEAEIKRKGEADIGRAM